MEEATVSPASDAGGDNGASRLPSEKLCLEGVESLNWVTETPSTLPALVLVVWTLMASEKTGDGGSLCESAESAWVSGSVFPVVRIHQLRVGDDLKSERFEGVVELLEALLPSLGQQAVELFQRVGIVGNLVHVGVKGLRVLDGKGEGVVLLMQRGE
ncbi:unnamed protein product [Clonostachys chloroleuca]|uniref:Uncharacterized protein n=1 Tax=Clonostachys chloroleuca TaxID=1926264 RepID=A0AA35LWP8_9HYPO|nr:unnamed protein product [Clonostachys chloroleuca]